MDPLKCAAWESFVTFKLKHFVWPSFSRGGITHAPGHTLPYYRGGKAWMRSNILLPYPTEHV